MDIHEKARLTWHSRAELVRRVRKEGRQIAVEVGVSEATVSRVLRRLGLNKLKALEPAEPVRRYERERPGDGNLGNPRRRGAMAARRGGLAAAPARRGLRARSRPSARDADPGRALAGDVGLDRRSRPMARWAET